MKLPSTVLIVVSLGVAVAAASCASEQTSVIAEDGGAGGAASAGESGQADEGGQPGAGGARSIQGGSSSGGARSIQGGSSSGGATPSGGAGGKSAAGGAGGNLNQTGGIGGQPLGSDGGKGGSPRPPGTLYAFDAFNLPAGDVNPDRPFGTSSGQGWNDGWHEGEHQASNFFSVMAARPLTFRNLAVAGNYMSHRSWDLGRQLDLQSASLAPFVQNGQVSKAGTVIWLSVLVRFDSTSVTQKTDNVFVTLHHGGLGYHYYNDGAAWIVGAHPSVGVNRWSLWVGSGMNTPEPDLQGARMSSKPVVVGEASLLVVKIELTGGASDKVSLFVNPVELGGVEPTAPDVTATTNQSAKFSAFAFAGGGFDGVIYESSFDEVRIGSTYASVTPTK